MFFMTKTVFSNLFSRYATRLHPFVVREPFPDARGELYCEIEKCIFCMTCQRKCPSQCITVDNKAGTWTCDPMACVYCGVCVDNCPVACLHQKQTYRAPTPERLMLSLTGTPPRAARLAKAKTPEAAPARAGEAKGGGPAGQSRGAEGGGSAGEGRRAERGGRFGQG